MLFWLVIFAIFALPSLVAFIAWRFGDAEYPGAWWFVTFVITGIVGSIFAFGILPYEAGRHATSNVTNVESRDLVAIGTDNATEVGVSRGIFVSRIWVDDQQVLDYTYQDADGGFRLDRADADRSVIYEDAAEEPYVEISHYEMLPDLFFAPYYTSWYYDPTFVFHIPEGSVVSEYVVTP